MTTDTGSAKVAEDSHAFFSRPMLENALMTPEQEWLVRQRACPKCHDRLTCISEGGGLRFNQCFGCGDIWVTEG